MVVFVSGCYSPTVSPGAPCETACPGDLACVDHVCREPGYSPLADAGLDGEPPVDAIDAPPGDADGDGILDDVDNCPADDNADQHDEDADAIGDRCDPCPHLAGTNVDGDGDGVGDACDPQPAIGKQRISFFDPFTSDRPEWTQEDSVSLTGDALLAMGGSYAGAVLEVPNAESRIVIGGTIESLVSGATEHQLSIELGRNNVGDTYYYAEFYDIGGSAGDITISRAVQGVYTTLDSTQYTGVLPLGAWMMRIDSSVAAQSIALASTLGGTSRPVLMGAPSALQASTSLGFFINGVNIRFDYFLVIETLP